jgi:thiamine-monophosphate kinase
MGARPRFFLLTLALPASQTGAWLGQFLRGIVRAARSLKMEIIGGDTTKSPRVSASITVLGEVSSGKALKRSGARPGDLIYVTGRLGRAQLGLELILAGLGRKRRFARFVRHHLYPAIHIELGAWLARSRIASAMIDVSDGLSSDLHRLCEASRVGARVEAGLIPQVAIPSGFSRQVRRLHLDPERMALRGGDDYALLFTVPKAKLSRLRRAPEFSKLTRIGEITRARQIRLVSKDGKSRRLAPTGWDPFKER